jgi:hypothetical protein
VTVPPAPFENWNSSTSLSNAVPHAEVVRDHDAIAEDIVLAAETCLQRRSRIEDAEPQPSLLVCRRSELTNVPSRTVTIQISAAIWIDQLMPIEVFVAVP